MAIKSELEELFVLHLRALKLKFRREYQAVPTRKWRWDFAIGDGPSILVEIQGGTWIKGAHSSGAGLRRDYEKNNAAVLVGYRLLYFDGEMVKSGQAIATVEKALGLA